MQNIDSNLIDIWEFLIQVLLDFDEANRANFTDKMAV